MNSGSRKGRAVALGMLCLWAGIWAVAPAIALDLPAAASETSVLAEAPSPAVGGGAVEDINPESATTRVERAAVRAPNFMVTAANPLATQAGADILAKGGSAADAVIAAQLVLNVVEPQSSGIGGGAFIVAYDAAQQRMRAYDARETATAAARSNRFMRSNRPIPFEDAVNSGLSVGAPGLLHGLALMHEKQGKLPWEALFQPAIKVAEEGFAVSPRLHALLDENTALRDQPAAAAYFYDAQGHSWPTGYRLRNPALAQVFRSIAQDGVKAFYTGPVAQDMVNAVAGHSVPGDLTLADLAGYRAKERPPVCAPYYEFRLCGMPPPSSGPLAVIQMLTILTHTPITQLAPNSLESVHYFSEAGKLAYADRDFYVADPDFIDVPTAALMDPAYLALRAGLIKPDHSIGIAPPGDPVHDLATRGRDASPETPSTTHIAAVDAAGNVVSMTSSIESAFGSKIFVRGFLLNNQLTDFSLSDVDAHGKPVANRVEPLKRPRSSMSPMIVLKYDKPYMAVGAPGGSAIINYVAKTILGVLNWNLNIQEAIDLPNRGSRNRGTELEKGTGLHGLVPGLTALGHDVREVDFPSGVQGLVITPSGIEGGADPRREGLALGG